MLHNPVSGNQIRCPEFCILSQLFQTQRVHAKLAVRAMLNAYVKNPFALEAGYVLPAHFCFKLSTEELHCQPINHCKATVALHRKVGGFQFLGMGFTAD